MRWCFRTLCGLILLAGAITWLSCDRPTAPANPNDPPDTKLANIPPDNDTVFALVTLNWNGGDYDGFITGYQYRYFTYHLAPGSRDVWVMFDSTAWADTTGSGATIAFNSSDSLNRQQFLVRAVDNDGNVDPTPAERIIYTPRTTPPITKILQPLKNSKVLVVSAVTDWWSGVSLLITAQDRTQFGSVVDYAWSVDGDPWNWVKDTLVYITPDRFKGPLDGLHVIRVTSRNNTNLIDPVGDSTFVTLIVPTFDKKILIIDETDEFNNPFITFGIKDSTVDNFYAEIFPGSESWDFKLKGMPPREVLAHYELLVWQADDIPASQPHKISDAQNIEIFTDYLRVGGKFLMSGWRILKSFAYTQGSPFVFPPGTFVHDYLHIGAGSETDYIGDCTGGKGKTGFFTDFRVDSVKLAGFPYGGKLSIVNLITFTAGFTDIMYSYVNRDNSQFVYYRGRAIGLRYYGSVFDAVVLGFPMYFVQKDDAKVMAREILHNMHVE